MFVALYGKTLEASLPNVTATAVVLVIPPHVARQQPLHELTQSFFVTWLRNEVEVIRHQAETKDLHRMPYLCISQ